MKLRCLKANPTENKTVLILDPVPRAVQAAAASEILGGDPDSEQVGFIEEAGSDGAVLRLQMMGGEFCGNAAISAAAYAAEASGLKVGESGQIMIEVSGSDEPVRCRIEAVKEQKDSVSGVLYRGTVNLPVPEKVTKEDFLYEGKIFTLTVVYLSGITHIIFDSSLSFEGYEEFAERAVKLWGNSLEAEAVGLICINRETGEMKPLVYVKPTDSLYWERGCGTGTAAAGVYLSGFNGSGEYPITQPGGVITAGVDISENRISGLRISGNVFFEEYYEKEVL